MRLRIQRAAVLGAGVMGAQIAALLAAAGITTHLLDLASPSHPDDPDHAQGFDRNFRSARAVAAIENLKQLKPSPLLNSASLSLLIPGNFEDDMDLLEDCDWVLEAVAERLDIKQNLHQKIARHVRAGVPVTTNTSGISLAAIAGSLPEANRPHFFGTHFFNPPRLMKLLEIIPHAGTDKSLLTAFAIFAEEQLGKGIVRACDTVNFIANRIGALASQSAMRTMNDLGLNVETVDALTGPLLGRPSSATFRTADIVGLDTGAAVALNTYHQAPNDPYRDWFLPPDWLAGLIEKGKLGQKTQSVGIYKKTKDADGQTKILAYRPASQSYEDLAPLVFPWQKAALEDKDTVRRIRMILEQEDVGSQFVWRHLRDIFAYASYLLNEIADGNVKPVDDAVRLGFNWSMGPFELWQALGYDSILARMQSDKVPLASWLNPGLAFYAPSPGSQDYRAEGPKTQWKADDQGHGQAVAVQRPAYRYHLPPFECNDPRVIVSNPSASLVDIGDGVACLVFHSKMNTIHAPITDLIHVSLEKVASGFQALVIGNDASNFSAGADIRDFVAAMQSQDWDLIDRMEAGFQATMMALKFAPFPIVSCPAGLTLGAGCEITMQTAYRVVAAETKAGLVEAGVGLFPAGGGTKELALRAYELAGPGGIMDPMPLLRRSLDLIRLARTSTSGYEAVEMGLYPASTTEVLMSKDRAVHRAKQAALFLTGNFIPKRPQHAIAVVGRAGIQSFKAELEELREKGQITHYDECIASRIACVLCGGDVPPGSLITEQALVDLERRLFVELCQEPKTHERMKHMLTFGKPLRN